MTRGSREPQAQLSKAAFFYVGNKKRVKSPRHVFLKIHSSCILALLVDGSERTVNTVQTLGSFSFLTSLSHTGTHTHTLTHTRTPL